MSALTAERPDGRILANKRELARILRCSLPTLAKLIDDNPDFPVVGRGSNGVEWQFDAERVIEFIREKRDEARDQAQQSLEEKAAYFGQFSLPIDDVVPEEAKGLSPTQRASVAKARLIERKLAVETGMLVPVAELRQILQGAFMKLGRSLDGLPVLLARQHGLPEEVARAMRSSIDDFRRTFVNELANVLRDDEA